MTDIRSRTGEWANTVAAEGGALGRSSHARRRTLRPLLANPGKLRLFLGLRLESAITGARRDKYRVHGRGTVAAGILGSRPFRMPMSSTAAPSMLAADKILVQSRSNGWHRVLG